VLTLPAAVRLPHEKLLQCAEAAISEHCVWQRADDGSATVDNTGLHSQLLQKQDDMYNKLVVEVAADQGWSKVDLSRDLSSCSNEQVLTDIYDFCKRHIGTSQAEVGMVAAAVFRYLADQLLSDMAGGDSVKWFIDTVRQYDTAVVKLLHSHGHGAPDLPAELLAEDFLQRVLVPITAAQLGELQNQQQSEQQQQQQQQQSEQQSGQQSLPAGSTADQQQTLPQPLAQGRGSLQLSDVDSAFVGAVGVLADIALSGSPADVIAEEIAAAETILGKMAAGAKEKAISDVTCAILGQGKWQFIQQLANAAACHQGITMLAKLSQHGTVSYTVRQGKQAEVSIVADGPAFVISDQAGAGQMLSTGINAPPGCNHVHGPCGMDSSKVANRQLHSNGAVAQHHHSAQDNSNSNISSSKNSSWKGGLLYGLSCRSMTFVGHALSRGLQPDALQRALDRGLLNANDPVAVKLLLCLACLLRHVKEPQTDTASPSSTAAAGAKQHEPAASRDLFNRLRYHTIRGLLLLLGLPRANRPNVNHPGLGADALVSVCWGPLRIYWYSPRMPS